MTNLPHANRLSQCSFYGPSHFESRKNATLIHVECNGPFTNGQRLSPERQQPAAASIVRLLSFCSPLTIARFVAAIVVDAVNLVTVAGAWTHICKKVLKGFKPPRTNANSSPAVVRIVGGSWCQASTFHPMPNTKLSRIGLAVRRFAFSRVLVGKASATFRDASSQAVAAYCLLVSTTALTIPHCLPAAPTAVRDDSQPTEDLPSKVYEPVADRNRMGFSHDVTLLNRVAMWLEPAGVCAPVPARFIIALCDRGFNP